MLRYVIFRLLASIITVFGVLLFTFLAIRSLPGDPALLLAGFDAGPQELEAIRARFGLDNPLPEQFVRYIEGILQGEFGYSLQTGRSVGPELRLAIEKTLILVFISMSITAVLGVTLGMIAAYQHDKPLDYIITTATTLGLSVPPFFLALILVFIFAIQLRWLPSIGSSSVRHLILPVATLVIFSVAQTVRMTRGTMLDMLKASFVRTAHAKGLHPVFIAWRHVLPNCAGPISTVLGLQTSYMFGGVAIVEIIFSFPGVGWLLVRAISARDFPIIQATVIFIAIAVVLSNLLADLAHATYDPQLRERLSGGHG